MNHRVRLRPIMAFLGIVLFSTANRPNIEELFNNYVVKMAPTETEILSVLQIETKNRSRYMEFDIKISYVEEK